MPAAVLDFWFDFASTYSYPAAMRIGALATDAEVSVRFRPFLLGPIFKAQGWTHLAVQPLSRQGAPHVARPRAAMRGLGPAVPAPRSVSAEQPARRPRRARRARAGAGRQFPGRGLLPRAVPRRVRRGAPDRRSRHHRRPAGAIERRAASRARGGAVGGEQGAAAHANRRGATARRVRRAELYDRGRRTVLGQRPARSGAALGAATAASE